MACEGHVCSCSPGRCTAKSKTSMLAKERGKGPGALGVRRRTQAANKKQRQRVRDTGTRPAFCWVDQKFVPVKPNEIFYQPNTSAWLWLFRFWAWRPGKLRLVQPGWGQLSWFPEVQPIFHPVTGQGSHAAFSFRFPLLLSATSSQVTGLLYREGGGPDSAPDQSGGDMPS